MHKHVPNDKPTSKNSNSIRESFLHVFVLCVVGICLAIFFVSPLQNSTTPKWALLLAPTLDKDFVKEIWFGVDLPNAPFSGERFIAFGLGALFVVAMGIVGRIFLRRIPSKLQFSSSETLFFSCGVGLVLASTLTFFLGVFKLAHFYILPEVAVVVIAFVLRQIYKKRRSTTSRVSKRSILCELKKKLQDQTTSRFDKLCLVCVLLLLAFFTAFYAFSCTQPIFEYDAVEYHVQGAREIYETGNISFSDRNVYTNMPLGSELFYVIGFNLADDAGYSAADVLRIGSLAGKTILTSFAFLTAFGILAFCRRFLRSTTIGLWGALGFLSFPGVFEVYVSGLNDCILSFTILSVVYVLLVWIQSLQQNNAPYKATYRLAVLLGVFLGFAIAVKYTGVVFVCIPAILATALALLFPQAAAKIIPNKPIRSETENNQVATEDRSSGQTNNTTFSIRLKRAIAPLCIVILTTIVIGGGWYGRNAIATGNPFYPLAYNIFGDSAKHWNPSVDQRWKHAHSSSEFGLKAFGSALSSSLQKDGMTSPFFLLVGISSCMILCVPRKYFIDSKDRVDSDSLDHAFNAIVLIKTIILVAILYWIAWYFTTHRLARFLLPIAPCTAILFGVYAAYCLKARTLLVKTLILGALLISFLYSGLMIDMLGQGRMAPLRALEQDPFRFTPASIYFNRHEELFDNANNDAPNKLLLVGEAKAFMYRVPILYSTCWNDSPLMQCLNGSITTDADGKVTSIVKPEEVRRKLQEAGIKYVLVDFSELARFRSKGNYGFNNPEITSELFQLMLNDGLIAPFEIDEMGQNESNAVQVFKVQSQAELAR